MESQDNTPEKYELPYQIINQRQLLWGARLLITQYNEIGTNETLVVVQNMDDQDQYLVARTPEGYSPNIVFMSPWEFNYEQ